jgi:hypothetical protein
VPSDVDAAGNDQRIVEAALLLPGDHGAVTGWADLWWRGGHWFDGLGPGGQVALPVPIVVAGSNLRPRDGVLVSKERLALSDIEVVDGLRVTPAVRSVLFEMRHATSFRGAVRAFDMAAFSDLVSKQEVSDYLDEFLSGWTGVPQARTALLLCDENAWSPKECDARGIWEIDAGLPRPLCNVPIFDLNGHHIGTPDLFDPRNGLAGEYDGAHHLTGTQRASDEHRRELFRRAGLESVTMLGADSNDPSRFISRLQTSYQRASIEAREQRWTLDQPHWWTPTVTVEQRRALPPEKRSLLSHRLKAA